jgi:hypothetical protein
VLFWSLNTPTCEVTPRFAHKPCGRQICRRLSSLFLFCQILLTVWAFWLRAVPRATVEPCTAVNQYWVPIDPLPLPSYQLRTRAVGHRELLSSYMYLVNRRLCLRRSRVCGGSYATSHTSKVGSSPTKKEWLDDGAKLSAMVCAARLCAPPSKLCTCMYWVFRPRTCKGCLCALWAMASFITIFIFSFFRLSSTPSNATCCCGTGPQTVGRTS